MLGSMLVLALMPVCQEEASLVKAVVLRCSANEVSDDCCHDYHASAVPEGASGVDLSSSRSKHRGVCQQIIQVIQQPDSECIWGMIRPTHEAAEQRVTLQELCTHPDPTCAVFLPW
nr:hypothetical protein CFP56_01243 [Quercus suber]